MVIFLIILALAALGVLGWWVVYMMREIWFKPNSVRLTARITYTIFITVLSSALITVMVILGVLVHKTRTADDYFWQVKDSTNKCATLQQVHNYHGHQHVVSTRTICP